MQKLKNIIFGIGAVAFTAFCITTIIFFVDLFFDFSEDTIKILYFDLFCVGIAFIFQAIHDYLED